MINYKYNLPVEIIFKCGAVKRIGEIIKNNNFKKGILICSERFIKNDQANEFIRHSNNIIEKIHFGISANPTIEDVENTTKAIKESKADFVVAIGGGSILDCAKISSSMVAMNIDIKSFLDNKVEINKSIPLIAIPTTAGTGSEVTSVSVISDKLTEDKFPIKSNYLLPKVAIIDPELTLSVPKSITASSGIDVLSHALESYYSVNNPIKSNYLLPKVAIIDPELTLSVPKSITASSGIDVLSHALESYYSVNNNPISDILAIEAIKLVMNNLEKVILDGENLKYRENMCQASLLAGMAFSNPISDILAIEAIKLVMNNLEKVILDGENLKYRENMCQASLLAGMAFSVTGTAACHGISYPLTSKYNIPHGEACGLTQDKVLLLNSSVEFDRIDKLSKSIGYKNVEEFAKDIYKLKEKIGLANKLRDYNIKENDLEKIASLCTSPNILSNPYKFNKDKILNLLESIY